MEAFFRGQIDYFLFLYGLSFVFLIAAVLALKKQGALPLPWNWLILFGTAQTFYQWSFLLTWSFGDGFLFSSVRTLIDGISFLFLIEFGRASAEIRTGRPGRWIFIPLLGLAALGGLDGVEGLSVSIRYVLALAGGIWASAIFLSPQGNPNKKKALFYLKAAGICFALYTAGMVVIVPGAAFFPSSVINSDNFFTQMGFPGEFFQGVPLLLFSILLWSYLRAYRGREISRYMKSDKVLKNLFLSAIFIILLLGWITTEYWGDRTYRELNENNSIKTGLLVSNIKMSLSMAGEAADSMSRSPWIIQALVSGAAPDIERANSVLDRYARSMGLSACYLLDIRGRVVASSDRNAPDSYLGKELGDRQYFREAAGGHPGLHLEISVAGSSDDGYYAAYPVKDSKGRVAGAVVARKGTGEIGIELERYAYCFLVNPEDTIVMSSSPDMVQKKFRLSEDGFRYPALIGVDGDNPDYTMVADIPSESNVVFHGRHYLISRQEIFSDGWRVVVLNPANQIWINRLFSIFTTLALCVLIVFFYVTLQTLMAAAAQVAISERRYYGLVNGSPNCVMLFDLEGRFMDINRSGLETMGWKRDDIIKRKFSEIWPEDLSREVEEAVSRVAGGGLYSFEGHCYRPDGVQVIWSVALYPIYDDEGNCQNIVGVSTNITGRRRAEKALRESEEKFRNLFDSANDAIIIMDGLVFTDCNPKTLQMFGCSREMIIGKSLVDFSPELQYKGESSEKVAMEHIKAVLDGESRKFQWTSLRPDGTVFETEINLSRVRLKDRYYVQAILRDITERKQREEQLRLHAAALQHAANAIAITDLKGVITWINPAFTSLTGYTEEEALGKNIAMLRSGNIDSNYYKNIWKTIVSGQVWQGEVQNRHKDGRLYIEEEAVTPVLNEWGEITHFVIIKQDVTDRRQQEQQLSYMATHDPLTSLPNRRVLEESLVRALARAERGVPSTLLFMDLDNFKLVNDTLGHGAGDQVLFTFTRVIQGLLRSEDLLTRFGGDEFAVLLEGTGVEEAQLIAERMRREVEEYSFLLDNESFHLTLSIGLVVIGGGLDPGVLLSRADAAMYLAKEQGRNRVVVYHPEDDVMARLTETSHWMTKIKNALAEGRFVLHYQPLYRLSDSEIAHYEVLVRMLDEGGNLVYPGVFIPVAERYGLMSQVDRWVFIRVMDLLRERRNIRLFVNLSGSSLADEALLSFIETQLRESGVDPSRLGFEITETAVVQDLAATERWVRRLKALGCRFALDDFGAGFNSFIYLHNLPVDQIKIDGYYIKTLENDPTRIALVQAMHSLALSLGMETVAEFVENEAILDIVKQTGITYGQGYYLKRPGPDLP
ncbi:MAG: bifunctional diguanylate cyclase/phosphodiesterase [Bacillota bacterium]